MNDKQEWMKKENTGYWTVLGSYITIQKGEKKERNGGTWWGCKCSCGNIIEVPGTLLVTGRKTTAVAKPIHSITQ